MRYVLVFAAVLLAGLLAGCGGATLSQINFAGAAVYGSVDPGPEYAAGVQYDLTVYGLRARAQVDISTAAGEITLCLVATPETPGALPVCTSIPIPAWEGSGTP